MGATYTDPATRDAAGRDNGTAAPDQRPLIGDRFREIRGWGTDLDPARRPGHPHETPSEVRTPRGRIPERQVPRTKVYVSIEHDGITPVFGTAAPPRLVSGLIRDWAFRYSEGRVSHWMLLLLADRVNVIEGNLEDLARGRNTEMLRDRKHEVLARFVHDRSRKEKMMLAGVAVGLAIAIVGLGND